MFVVVNKGFKFSELKTPFFAITVIFILFMLPSFFNNMAKTNSGLNMFMWPGFILLFTLLAVALRDIQQINLLTKAFLTFVTLNSVYAIFQGITTGRRAFGFAGIMFVDILGIAIIIVFILLLHAKGKSKAGYGSLFALLVLAMIFNKTRNVWINVAIVMMASFIHVAVKAKFLEMDRKKILRYGIIALLFVGLSGGLLISFTGQHFSGLKKSKNSLPRVLKLLM
ncbi:MAG: hypothetical protein IPJ75_03545 [Ignavibacteriales bacterium]|nr:hypothetical protein [Ignavibacteriales bacterium]